MAHGGPRKGAGRKPGQTTKLNETARQQALEGGITPLAYMLTILRDETISTEDRFEAAKAAAPYVHARLAAVEHSGDMTVRHEDALDELDDEPRADDPPTAKD
jgi:triphosphoribosyl-dephospho-CoA synthetase